MSTINCKVDTGGVGVSGGILPVHSNSRPLHRISEVRQQQGVSLRSVARRLGTTIQEARQEEDAHNDMRLSELHVWQKLLDVPLADLLVDNDAPLSDPVCKRARLLRVMKTAKAIHESAQSLSIKRLTSMLVSQLIELMPELADVAAWNSVGQRRTQDELGKIAENPIPENFFTDNGR